MLSRSELAKILGGELVGNDDEVFALRNPEFAGPNDVVFVRWPNFLEKALQSGAGLVVTAVLQPVTAVREPVIDQNIDKKAFIYVTDLEDAWQKLLNVFSPKLENLGIHKTAVIHQSAEIAENVQIGPNVVIAANAKIGAGSVVMAQAFIGERTIIGKDCQIHQNATLRHDVVLGDRVLIQSGAVIGSEGFGFRVHGPGQYSRLSHNGKVIIDDDVEIGANTVVERAVVEATTIGAGSKINGGCFIGHNCQIGRGVVLIGGVVIAGSVVLEDGVTLWGHVAVAGHLTIGKGATVTAKSGVSKSLPAGGTYRGIPARPVKEYLRMEARLVDIDNLFKRVKELEEKLGK